jgi:hypothetical protein
VVAKPACDDGVVHDRFVGLIFEIAVPPRAELWTRPLVHHVKFFFCRAYLNASFDTICGERSGAVNVPLLEDAFLDCWIAASKVIERLYVRLCTIGSKGETVLIS